VKVAYLVVSHRNPDQILRLVRVLREGGGEVAVRHDGRREPLPASALQEAGARALEDGIDLAWGDTGYLRMQLNALEWAARELDPDWVVFLSGQDYPLRPLADIEAGLAATEADARLSGFWELATRRDPGGEKTPFFRRYAYRHFIPPAWLPERDLPRAVAPLAYRCRLPGDLPDRVGVRWPLLPFGDGFRAHVSADWLTLNRRAVAAVTAFARAHARVMRHYRRTIVPAESFFATVLANDPSLRVDPDGRRFISWPRPGAPHPDTLTSDDLDRVLASGMDFARKFDTSIDARVLDLLDDARRVG
jgi:hypothetical protein